MNAQPHLIVSLLQGSKAVVSTLTTICAEADLSADEWLILDALAEHEDLSMAELSSHVAVAGATLTRAVDRLLSKALVYRMVSPLDRRKIRVHLSTRGMQVHETVAPRVAGLEDEIRAALGVAGVLGDDLAAALGRLSDLTNGAVPAPR